ncbi:MAG: hypothetical protein V7749_00310 [Cocleimonas sp.]|jgi:hypothetical protein
MLNQLNQLNTIGGAERINLSIQFLAANKARVVVTTQVDSNATGDLADLLRNPIVLTGSLSDIDVMLTNELFSLSEQISQPTNDIKTLATTPTVETTESDDSSTAELIENDDESL